MDPITVILTALAKGGIQGLADSESAAVEGFFATLKAKVRRRLASRPDGELVLSRYESDPQTWREPLATELRGSGADQDADLVAVARELLDLVKAAGGQYHAEASGGGAVQIWGTGHHFGGDVVGRDKIVNLGSMPPAGRLDPELPLHNLPERAREFLGRGAEMGWLAAAAGSVGARRVVYGLSGVGKSELALQHAHQHIGDRVVWWITAASRADIDAGLIELAQRMSPGIGLFPPADILGWTCKWLQRRAGHPRWLLVLDDVRDYADIKDLLGKAEGAGQVLITTRRELAAGPSLRLGVLTSSDSVELLRQVSDGKGAGDEDAYGQIAAEVEFLPLALRHAGAYIRQTLCGPHSYLTMLRTSPVAVYDQSAIFGDDGRSLVRTLEISLCDLDKRYAGVGAKGILRVLACMGPVNVPRCVLEGRSGAATTALGVLASYSLVTLSKDAVSSHRLVRNIVRHYDPSLAATLKAAISQLLNALPAADPADRFDDLPLWRALIPHVRAVAQLAAPEPVGADLGHLLNRAVPFLRIERQDARELAELARLTLERELGRGEPQTLQAWHNLAAARRAGGELSCAIELFDQTVTERIRVLGPDDPDTLDSRSALANARAEAGHPDEAAAELQDVISRSSRTRGPAHPSTLRAQANLAVARQDGGHLRQAADLYTDLLPKLKRAMGDAHPDVLTVEGNRAQIREELGEFALAVPIRRNVAGLLGQLFGEDHPRTLDARRSLSRALAGAGDTQAALALAKETAAALEEAGGKRHPETLRARMTLAFALAQGGQPAEAADLIGQVLADRVAVLGGGHPDVILTRINLAEALVAADKLDEALAISRTAVRDCGRLLDPGHRHAVHALMVHASALAAARQFTEAVPVYRQVVEEAERALSLPGSSLVFQCQLGLIACERKAAAADLIAAGDERAIPILQRAAEAAAAVVDQAEKALGPQHPDMPKLRHSAAMLQRSPGE